MSVEVLAHAEMVNYLLPLLAITALQAKAIFSRDNDHCIFPFEHICVNKLRVHHIKGKRDDPTNLGIVCIVADLNYLHNRTKKEERSLWQEELTKIASENTEKALANGWTFPKK